MGNGCYVCTYTLPIDYAEEEEEVEDETRPQTAVAVLGGLGAVRQAQRVQVGHLEVSPFDVGVSPGITSVFTAPFDTNGVLHYITTDGG